VSSMSLYKELNEQQRRAVEAEDGPVLIVAGPGTGKTKTLTARIAHLLTTGVAPGEITALTFTNKAAKEMRERVMGLLGHKQTLPRIATFHALGHEFLSQQTDEPLRFVGEAERLAIIRALPKSTELKALSSRELAGRISRSKNSLSLKTDDLAKLVARYNKALVEKGWHDFDDLLAQTYQLLSDDMAIRQAVAKTCRYLLVDEFQDTNELQYQLLRLIRGSDNLFIIGDPLQSIYGFRGASGGIFQRFKIDFPAAQEITLTTNYRSAPEIIALSNAVFPDAPELRAYQKQSGRVQAVQVLNDFSEANWIVSEIDQHLGGTDMLKSHSTDDSRAQIRQFSDYAVLYRTHRVAKVLEQKMADSGIPYQVVGDDSPYEQPLIKTILQTLRFLAEGEAPSVKGVSPSQLETLLGDVDMGQPLSRLVEAIIRKLGLDQEGTHQRLSQFMSTLVHFDAKPLADYLKHIDDIAEQGFYDAGAEAVTLLTIHAAKGLEFTHVFLVGAEEGLLPFMRKDKPTDVEEERRLFYVAVTRAQQQLDILYTKSRGSGPAELSRFVRGISGDILPRLTDPAMASQQKRQHKRRLKRAQQTLF
jgi:superfamily I DNA/RNA helicase